jgi:CubicO group peptidase (beta-lactamase class C family)
MRKGGDREAGTPRRGLISTGDLTMRTIPHVNAAEARRAAQLGTLHATRRFAAFLVFVLAVGSVLAAPTLGAAQGAPPPAGGLRAGAPAWTTALSAFGDALARDVAADDLGGIVAGVAVDGDLVWAGAFGWADRERNRPMSTSAISRTGSISKPVTALLLMRLVDRGVVGLDDPVVRYLPELSELDDPDGHVPSVTFRLLASHQAGLIREPRLPGAASGPIQEWTTQVLRSIPTTGFAHPPGTATLYSNIGYGILGLALSRAAGAPFIELVEAEIFAPLGMTGSTFVVSGALRNRLAAGYVRSAAGFVDGSGPAREHAGRGYKVPNGGVYSTVADLARFAAAASGTPGLEILSERARKEFLTIQTPTPGAPEPQSGYGIGFSIERTDSPSGEGGRNEGRIVSHGGSVAGYTAHMVFDPETRISVILLRNYGSGATNLGRVSTSLLRELLAAPE